MPASFRPAAASLLAVVALSSIALTARQAPAASVQTTGGLHVTNFTTPQGRVSVLLPADVAAGDRVSGTVRLAPGGADAEARQRNLAGLQRYNVQVGDREIAAGAGRFSTVLPAPGTDGVVSLSGANFERVSSALPIQRAIPTPARYRFPGVGQARMPLQIEGRFDGDIGTTELSVGGTPATILAESPRGIVAQSPDGVVGPTELILRESGRTVRNTFRNVALELSSPRSRLRRSEQTTVTATIRGLADLTAPLELTLSLATGNVAMDGGNTQRFRIAPADVGAGGVYTVTRTLTAAGEGGFVVSAVLPAAGMPDTPLDGGGPRVAAPAPAPAVPAPAPAPAVVDSPRPEVSTPRPPAETTPITPATTTPRPAEPVPTTNPGVATNTPREVVPSEIAAPAAAMVATPVGQELPIAGVLGGLALLGVLGGLLVAGAQAGQGPMVQQAGTDDSGTDPRDERPEHETWQDEVDHAGIDEVLKKYDTDDPRDADPDDDPRDADPATDDDPRDAQPAAEKPDSDDPRDEPVDDDDPGLAEYYKWLEETHGATGGDDPRDGEPDGDDPRDAEPADQPTAEKPQDDDPRDAGIDPFPEDAEELEDFGKWLEENHGGTSGDDPRDEDVDDETDPRDRDPNEDDDPRDLPVPAPAAATPHEEHDHDPRDQPVTEEELRAYLAELEQLKAKFAKEIEEYNATNAKLSQERANLEARRRGVGLQIDELINLLANWDPKKAPPKLDGSRTRIIERNIGPDGLLPPTGKDVKDAQGYSRLMTQREVEEEIDRLRDLYTRMGHMSTEIDTRQMKAWEELTAAGEAVARAWEEVESALNNQNCHHATREWSTPGPGGFTVNGDGFVTSWWMPPTIKLPEKKTDDDPRDAGNPWADLIRHGDTTCGGMTSPPFKLFPDPPRPGRGGMYGTHPGGGGGVATPAPQRGGARASGPGVDGPVGDDPPSDPYGHGEDLDWEGLDELQAEWDRKAREDGEEDEVIVPPPQTIPDDFGHAGPAEQKAGKEDDRVVQAEPVAREQAEASPAGEEPEEIEAPTLSEEERHALQRMLDWVRSIPGASDPDHPLSHLLLALASQVGVLTAEGLTRELMVGDPLTALTRILERLAERSSNPEMAVQVREILVQLLDRLADEDEQGRWGITDPARIAAARAAAISALVDDAIRAGSLDALLGAFTLLARPPALGGRPDDPRIAQIRQRLETLVKQIDAVEDAEALEQIRSGRLSLEDLEALAAAALEQGKLPLFVEASLSLIDRRQIPLDEKVGQALAVVEMLRAVGATELLEMLPARLEVMLGPQLDEALRAAMEEVGALTVKLDRIVRADTDNPSVIGAAGRLQAAQRAREAARLQAATSLQEAQERVRELARLRAMLATGTLEGNARRAALDALLARANTELRDHESTLGRYLGKDVAPHLGARAEGRRDALRAARDAVQDLILSGDPDALQAELREIYEALNGTWHHKATDYSGANFRENGVRQRLDAALQEDSDSEEVRRLLDEMQYLERRRIQILFLNPSWNALEQWQGIKEEEERYWSSQQRWNELKWLGQTQADRVLADVGQFRARDLPGLLSELGNALGDPQGFIRYLARLRAEDVRRGGQAWAAYHATPWQKRGLVVQTWRLMHADEIQREMHQDRLFAQALTLAAEMSAAQLRAQNPAAYRRLEQAGFIGNGEYVIPEKFKYDPETTGSRMSERHWSDKLLNVESGLEMVATILLPGAAAGRLVGGLRSAYQFTSGLRAALPLARLALAEGALFTLFNNIAHGAIHGAPLSAGSSPAHLARELGMNIVTLGGLALMNRLAGGLEKKLINEQLLNRAFAAPVQQLTREQIRLILQKGTFEGIKLTSEAAAFTGLGLLPGMGGELSLEAFFHNLVFISQLRAAGLVQGLAPRPRPPIGAGSRPAAGRTLDRGRSAEAPEHRRTEDIAEEASGRVPATPELVRQFGEWFGGTLRSLKIDSSPRLRARLVQELESILKDPKATEALKQSARTLRTLLRGGKVNIRFENQGDAHGAYSPVNRRATIFVAEIAKSLFLRYSRLGRRPTEADFINAVLGTTAHEAMAHGLQGTDARRWADGEPLTPRTKAEADGAGGLTRPYSELHEIEAFMEQRRYDPTLNGRDPHGARRTDAEALREIIAIVNRIYTSEQIARRNAKTLKEMDPEAYAVWEKASKTLTPEQARTYLAELFFEHVYKKGTPIADRVRRAAERLREMQQGFAEPTDAAARTRRVETERNLKQAVRDFLNEMEIKVEADQPIRRKHLTQLAIRMRLEYQKIVDNATASPEARAAAEQMVEILTSQIRAWLTPGAPGTSLVTLQFSDVLGDGAGGYRRHTNQAFIYLRTIAERAEVLAKQLHGRSATADDFLRVLMGTTAHEALAHGIVQGMRIPLTGQAEIGAAVYRRIHELQAFLTQRLFDPYLGANTTGDLIHRRGATPEEIWRDNVETIMKDLVEELYRFEVVESQAEMMLARVDTGLLNRWVELRKALEALDAHKGDAEARARADAAMEALPLLSRQAREAFAGYLGEIMLETPGLPSPEVPKSLNEMKMVFLDELLALRQRPGTQVDRAVDRLRERRKLTPRPRNVPAEPAAREGEQTELKPASETDLPARLSGFRDALNHLRNRVAGDPLEGLPTVDVAHWRRGVTGELALRQSNEQIAELAELVRRNRDAGVPEDVILRGLEWLRGQSGLNDTNLRTLERFLFLEAAAAAGVRITISPADREEFERFAGPSDIPIEFFDLARMADIRAKVALQVSTGEPHLTRADLEFIRQRVFPRGPMARSMFEFERAVSDLNRAELSRVFPEEFIENIGILYGSGRPPRAIEDIPVPPPAPPGAAAPDSPLRMFRGLPREVQQKLLDQVADVARGFDLHRWYRAVKGKPDGELALLTALRSANIGDARGAATVSAEIEARLASVPSTPKGLSLVRVREAFEKALEEWRKAPGDAAAALRWLRLRVLLGAFSHRSSSAPFVPGVPGPGALSADQALRLFGGGEPEVMR